ncbi:TAXI family TRAP transporter solute-binding subunit [Acuticoccus sp. MNP-M23]|uniref:TAXI family TRAP transporter solute-binding subunit n=1 Tax=Acuticoccus sp. MNP-M23 TaxID=3072793 RepID=UPI002814CA55|nr:TAXI family TRAP transporter solute-binding subunit [Acuticoccus sp. MNP-M23]WMS42219.1 TAXI family TRAP transporter solute-binding subunit [Acuticoccus sp. MNP-M23]
MRTLTPRTLVVLVLGILVVAVPVAYFAGLTRFEAKPLRISSGTDGGTYRAFANAMDTTFTAENVTDLVILPSAGANENAARLNAGEADFGLIQSDTAVQPDTLVVARLFPEAFHLVGREGSGIESVSDLRGKRVGLMPQGSGSNALFAHLLRHYEVPFDALTIAYGTLAEHADAIAIGEIDAFFMVIALGNDTIEDIIERTPTQLVPIEQAEAIALFDPALSAAIVPTGTYSGDRPVPARPIPVVTVQSLLAARGALDDGTVEAVTRALFENRQRMVRQIPQAAFIAAPSDDDRLAFGIHPGAELYYSQDDPLFIVEYAEPMALAVTALALLISGLWQARIWLAGARKNRADHYNLAIVDIIGRAELASTDGEFGRIRRELFDIFEKVIVDLDNDRIEERSLVSFSFAWQVAASTLNHRQLVVASGEQGGQAPAVADPFGDRDTAIRPKNRPR